MAALAIVASAGSLAAWQGQPGQTQGAGQTQTQGQGPGRAGQTPAPAPGQATGRGQQPARDNLNQPVGTGTIMGWVLTDGTGTPVRHARVNLNAPELRGARATTTDDQGRFSFTSLPAGRFSMSASKPGYVNISYGAKKPGRAGTPIQLADGQKIDKAVINLPKGSVMTGVVVDENGDPSPQTQVRAMRFVTQTGEKTLQQAGSDQTDDRGIYRIYGLQPGDYIISAVPRNANIGDIAQTVMAEVESLMQQAQAAGGGVGAGGRGAGGGRGGGGGALGNLINGGGGRGQQLLDRAGQLQQQVQQQQQAEQTVGYAPVYYPGTTVAGSAASVKLSVGEERVGIDFQLQLVPTAKMEGLVRGPDGSLPPGTQVSLVPAGQQNMPTIPGVGTNMARTDQSGHFTFSNVTPGPYTLMARSTIRDTSAAAGAPVAGGRGAAGFGGPGGRGGGPGTISQVLWASTDVTVAGQNLSDVQLNLQPGMTVSGRIAFESTSLAVPADLTRVRVVLAASGQQALETGNIPPAEVDATGNFKIMGVAPGRYTLRGNVPPAAQTGQAAANAAGGRGARGGGGAAVAGGAAGTSTGTWTLKSALVGGRDTLDFPLEIRPNEEASGAVLTFTDKTQELSGTLQDASGRPTADYTIVVFAVDTRYWTPQSRRIASTRPGTDGKFTIRSLPPGDYRLTAVTDAEPGEWYDPAFLSQIVNASLPISLGVGEKKTQDIKLAGGGWPPL